MQQIKIANMNANDPAMTRSSPMNAGILVWIRIESWDWCWYLSSYMTGFLHSILWGAQPHIKKVLVTHTHTYLSYLPELLTGVYPRA